jgi:hypothetical protein
MPDAGRRADANFAGHARRQARPPPLPPIAATRPRRGQGKIGGHARPASLLLTGVHGALKLSGDIHGLARGPSSIRRGEQVATGDERPASPPLARPCCSGAVARQRSRPALTGTTSAGRSAQAPLRARPPSWAWVVRPSATASTRRR